MIKQCKDGHLYDDSKYDTCPYCYDSSTDSIAMPVPVTVDPVISNEDYPIACGMMLEAPLAYYRMTVGWLVCISGTEQRGSSFELYDDRNKIVIHNNPTRISVCTSTPFSGDIDAIISYDKRNGKFFLLFGSSKNNIYVNNQLIITPIEIQDYDVIEIGKVKMVFRSFCNIDFNWAKFDDSDATE